MIRPIALILEDDLSNSSALADRLAVKNLDVRQFAAAAPCRRTLRPREVYDAQGTHETVEMPSLAIVDLDLSLSGRPPTPEDTSLQVLKELAKGSPTCTVIVWSATVRENLLDVNLAHPRSIAVDKAFGLDHLLQVIDGLLDHQAGDLELVADAHCRHIPSGDIYRNQVAFELLCHHRMGQPFITRPREAGKVKAIQRFRSWLVEHGSTMTVVAKGNWRYELADKANSAEPSA